mmetsp:Transcript_7355/g.12804  ORF Transcript_7355/g.12804 Transcript_7355/m.12804 type:complete len:324 (-) Transcript_7355:766-1737(-)
MIVMKAVSCPLQLARSTILNSTRHTCTTGIHLFPHHCSIFLSCCSSKDKKLMYCSFFIFSYGRLGITKDSLSHGGSRSPFASGSIESVSQRAGRRFRVSAAASTLPRGSLSKIQGTGGGFFSNTEVLTIIKGTFHRRRFRQDHGLPEPSAVPSAVEIFRDVDHGLSIRHHFGLETFLCRPGQVSDTGRRLSFFQDPSRRFLDGHTRMHVPQEPLFFFGSQVCIQIHIFSRDVGNGRRSQIFFRICHLKMMMMMMILFFFETFVKRAVESLVCRRRSSSAESTTALAFLFLVTVGRPFLHPCRFSNFNFFVPTFGKAPMNVNDR